MALVLDTGVLYASLDADDEHHSRCVELLEEYTEPLVIPAPVLVELDYFVRKKAGVEPWLIFCEQIEMRSFSVFSLDAAHVARAARVQVRFSDHPIGFVDASVLITCEALGEEKVATLDRRHFSVLRTESGAPLELLPG